MIKTTLNGRLTADPQIQSDPTRCNVTIAADSNHYNKETKQTKTEFFRVTIWGKRAETFATYCHKGDPVIVSGDFHSDEYVGRDKEKHNQLYLDNADFTFLPRGNGGNSKRDEDDDDLLDD